MAKMIPMNMVTPPPELAAITALQSKLVSALRPILPKHALLWEPEDTIPYECDGLAAYRRMPLAVALPETEAQVAQILNQFARITWDNARWKVAS